MNSDFLHDNNLASLWKPPPKLTVSQWADEFRRIPPEAAAEPGMWDSSRAPYQREMMDALSDENVERVVMMTAAQIGKTEMLLNILGYFIDKDPAPVLVLYPTLAMGMAFSKDRLAPMLRDSPCFSDKILNPRTRDSGNTLLHKTFPGGQISIAGTNSPASLASRPIRILLCDEVDHYPESAGEEGDPLSLAMKRTQNFWNRKILWVSTPTLKKTSRIQKAYELSTREEWCIHCPSCGYLQPYDWERILYKDRTEPVMKCQKCNKEFSELDWKRQPGEWVAGSVSSTRGFHLNAFASVWTTWAKLIADYEEAQENGESGMKVWVNTVLGLPFESTEGVLDPEELEERRETYGAELPEGVLVLTCGVDTQDDRLECEVVGWGAGHESWGIEYRVIYGDPGGKEVWEDLDALLGKMYHFADGTEMGISCTCVDSAGHYTDDVYRFCRPRARRRIFAIVGRGKMGMPSVSKASLNNRSHTPLITLGVSTIKGYLYSRLHAEKGNAGYCHFPEEPLTGHRGYDKTYFAGLVSERMVVKRVKGREVIMWETRYRGVRNEPLDCRVYATGALEVYNPDMTRQKRKLNESRGKTEKPVSKPTEKRLKRGKIRVLRRGYMI